MGETARRVDEVLNARLNGAEFHDLKAYAAEKGWNVCDRMIWNYIARSDKILEEGFEKSRKKLLRRHIAQRRALYMRALEDGDTRTALAILGDEAQLQSLYPPKRTELTGKGGKDLPASPVTIIEVHEQLRPTDGEEA